MDRFFNVGKLFVVFMFIFGLYACGSSDAETISLDVDPVSIEDDFFYWQLLKAKRLK